MTRTRTTYRCSDCGAAEPKWAGRCGSCGRWNSLVEEPDLPPAPASLAAPSTPLPICDVDTGAWTPVATGVAELDRVLGGGLVPGSVTLLAGEPGIGKSTLVLQALAGLARQGRRCLYVTAEESAAQVRARADRLGAAAEGLWLVSETALPHLLHHLEAGSGLGDVDVVVVDSVQTLHDPALASAPGTVAQVRECANRLVARARAGATATVLVGHVTKDGGIAGPRVLEHVVDTVLSFEGERHHALRLLRAVKHRFGATDELGLFAMTGSGLEGVDDPSALFLADRLPGVAGSVVVPVLDGHRPLLVELQALVVGSTLPAPRRSAQGLDAGRLAVVLAVLERRVGLRFSGSEVHTLAAGGVKVTDPGADLGLALALASARHGIPLPDDLVACGEVGLTGELRQVHRTPQRLAEAARLGLRRVVLPASGPTPPPGLVALRAATVAQAVALAGLDGGAGWAGYDPGDGVPAQPEAPGRARRGLPRHAPA